MLRFLADENFNGRILRALRRRVAGLDLIRVQDTELYQGKDPDVLAWAAAEGRVTLTHDTATLLGHAYRRVEAGLPMAGVIAVPAAAPIGRVVEDIEILCEAGRSEELADRVLFLPL